LPDLCLIASVPHSGTRFTRDLLKQHGWHERSGRRRMALWHFDQGARPAADVIICPLRHPQRVAEAWAKRGKAVEWIEPQVRRMVELEAYFLPIDSPTRDEYLDAISDRLGITLTTTWRPLHVSKAPLREPVDDAGLFDKFRSFYGRFYD
jgi:hypothetical protein